MRASFASPVVPPGANCPVCGHPRAPGTRFPSRYCARPKAHCRQRANRRKGALTGRFVGRRPARLAPPLETLAAMALRQHFGAGAPFTAADARTAAGASAVHLDAAQTAKLLDELVDDGLLVAETVTASGRPSFTFPSHHRRSAALAAAEEHRARAQHPKRGARGVRERGRATG